jgi:hypothetical protein
MMINRALSWYYAATLVFVVLDFGFNVNIRVAFLETMPLVRTAYYGVCFACFALIVWRPSWSTLIGTVESLITVVALILSMGIHILIPNDAIIEKNAQFVTTQEIINFLIAGSVAYYAWIAGLKTLKNS